MQTLKSFILCFIFYPVLSYSQPTKKADWVYIKTKINCVRCTECEKCSSYIYANVSLIKGVKKMHFNPEKMIIAIYYNTGKTFPRRLREKISQLGYDADKIKADSLAQSQLNLCCKKL